MKPEMKKLIIANLPYLLFVYLFGKLGQTYRLAAGADLSEKLLHLADYYGGLHCGETFDVMVGGRWRPTRIEMAENWYLVGIHADDLSGLRVRI